MTTTVRFEGDQYVYYDDYGVRYAYDPQTQDWVTAPESKPDKKRKHQSEPQTWAAHVTPKRRQGVMALIIHWLIKIVTFPIVAIGHILDQFYGVEAPGKLALGALGFFAGVMVGADNFWQLFGGKSLFPFFEQDWIGWGDWVLIWLFPTFWLALGLSALVQVKQGQVIRGKTPEQAKLEYKANVHKLGTPPNGTIDLTRALWQDYKRSGMRRKASVGVISVGFWAFEGVSAFAAHWPLAQETAGLVLACSLYCIFTIFAGEIGYALWESAKEGR